MAYESTAEPIKIGFLMDVVTPESFPQERREEVLRPFELVFGDGLKRGLIDRPVEVIYREVEGLPKGSVKAVIEAYGDMVDEGCLAVYGPHISDNIVPVREAIDERFHVASITNAGTDDALGEWGFSLPLGSLTDEPIFWAELLAKGGHNEVGVLVEQSLVGETYLRNFRNACRYNGIRIVAEVPIAQTAQDLTEQVRALHEAKASAIVHCGFGFGLVGVNPALAALNWDPPRFCGTAFQNAWLSPAVWDALIGWTGVDQYDESNPVCQAYFDRYEQVYGSRPDWIGPVVNRDAAETLLRALADAHPLSPRGVKEALERVKMMPAAVGAPGTRISYGKWTRRGWMGAGYLIARQVDPDGVHSHLVGRFGE